MSWLARPDHSEIARNAMCPYCRLRAAPGHFAVAQRAELDPCLQRMISSASVHADLLDRSTLIAALRALGISRLVCSLFERCISEESAQDLGFGSLYSQGGQRLLDLVHSLGFDSLLCGPSGQTTPSNSSPYDGTIFARSHLSISIAQLVEDRTGPALLSPEELATCAASRPPLHDDRRTNYAHAFKLQGQLLGRAYVRWQRGEPSSTVAMERSRRLALFRAQAEPWLIPHALYHILCDLYGSEQPEHWRGSDADLDARLYRPRVGEQQHACARIEELCATHKAVIEQHTFVQHLAHEQHADFVSRVRARGMRLIGDLQAGMSIADRWAHQSVLLPDYVMGAPPSRTNPNGQPWGYPVLDPDQYVSAEGRRGPSLQLLAARIQKMLREYDAVRIDHPHALVCPWVYRAHTDDPYAAVRGGARLFSSPDLSDHPRLARWAIARRADLTTQADTPRFADRWVENLDDAQVHRYGLAFDVVIDETLRTGQQVNEIICEVLSTMPYPLERVLRRHGLGRFRVTQKADPSKPDDVYLADNAHPNDWIMVGNHDTPPLLSAVESWRRHAQLDARASYLAKRLAPEHGRARLTAFLQRFPDAVAAAELASLFAGPARNVLVFVFDLLGETESFNVPGTISPQNWSLRLPRDLEEAYVQRVLAGRAMNMPLCLALAMRARGDQFVRAHAGLLARLEATARASPLAGALLDAYAAPSIG